MRIERLIQVVARGAVVRRQLRRLPMAITALVDAVKNQDPSPSARF